MSDNGTPNLRKMIESASAGLLAVLVAGILVGCASYKPYEYQDDRNAIKGPGLFSGKDGVFTIYGKAPEESSNDSKDKIDAEKNATATDRSKVE